jgi:hypothetical protein
MGILYGVQGPAKHACIPCSNQVRATMISLVFSALNLDSRPHLGIVTVVSGVVLTTVIILLADEAEL